MESRRLKPEEMVELNNISAVCFEWKFNTEGKSSAEYYDEYVNNREKANSPYDYFLEDIRWGSFYNGVMTGGMTIIPYKCMFDGNVVDMAGIGGVCTLPEYRRHGGIRSIFEKALPAYYNEGVVLSYLYPFSQSYYEKFGYALADPRYQFMLNLKHIVKCDTGNITMYRGGDISDFKKAYEKMAAKYNNMIVREFYDWGTLKDADPSGKNRFAFLCKDDNGEPIGYMIFEKGEHDGHKVLNVLELIYDNTLTLKKLMNFAVCYSSDYGFILFHAPIDFNPEVLCTDLVLSMSGSARKHIMNGMHRVINVKKVLELAKYKNDGDVVIAVTDNIIKENTGNWHVKYTGGIAVLVEKTENAYDIQMDIKAFSSAIIGRYEIETISDIANVDIVNQNNLENIFYKKKMFISNFF